MFSRTCPRETPRSSRLDYGLGPSGIMLRAAEADRAPILISRETDEHLQALTTLDARLQSSHCNNLARQRRAGILTWPDAFDPTYRACT